MPDACHDHGQKGTTAGYGSLSWEGRNGMAHRKVYAAAHNLTRSEMDGLVVRHKCDNPRCINPNHLEVGTHADNVQDCIRRGR